MNENRFVTISADDLQRILSTPGLSGHNHTPLQNDGKHPMEFSKKLMLWASAYFALFGIASFVMWVLTGDWPREIALFFIGPIIGLASYMIKSAYENKAKILCSSQLKT